MGDMFLNGKEQDTERVYIIIDIINRFHGNGHVSSYAVALENIFVRLGIINDYMCGVG